MDHTNIPITLAQIALASALLTGCTGALSDPPGAAGDSPPDGYRDQVEAARRCEAVASPLRRLSHDEYRAVMRDLFPGVGLPPLELTADPTPHGFDNDVYALGISDQLVFRYHDLANSVAAAAVRAPSAWLGCDDPRTPECEEALFGRFGRRAFRRPLTEEERSAYRVFLDDTSLPAADALHLTIQAMLEAPELLYRVEGGVDPRIPLDFEIASRLSFFLWGSMPDDYLLDLAEMESLNTAGDVRAQAARMLDDGRAAERFVSFHRQWLELDRIDRVTKETELGFDDAMRSSIRGEAERFLGDIVLGQTPTLEALLTSRETFVDARLASLYGVEAPADGWQQVTLPPERGGILTHAGFLAGHGHTDEPSPIQRGVTVMRRVACRPLGEPPPGAAAAVFEPLPGVETSHREEVERVTAADTCRACHDVINPLGFAFEHFDTIGRFRESDRGLPIDASGESLGFAFGDASELTSQLAMSDDVAMCVTTSWLRFAYGGGPQTDDPCLAEETRDAFVAEGRDLRELLVDIASNPKFFLPSGAER